MDDWDAIRSAYEVAKHGTVSAAAERLGLHRATVNRHIDLLEEALGEKLFQRHARGYTPTELGQELLSAAQKAEQGFDRLSLAARSRQDLPSGPLKVMCDPYLHFALLDAIGGMCAETVDLRPEVAAVAAPLNLESGAAHAALITGRKPENPDYVVRRVQEVRFGLYQRRDPVSARGLDAHGRRTVVMLRSGEPGDLPDLHARWLGEIDGPEPTILFCEHSNWVRNAIEGGLGAGFLPVSIGEAQADLVDVAPARESWRCDMWFVAHVDLVRSAKVQLLLRHLRLTVRSADIACRAAPAAEPATRRGAS